MNEASGNPFIECSNLRFYVDSQNTNFKTLNDNRILISFDEKTLYSYPSATGILEIPTSIEKIDTYALRYCNITDVIIPDNVKILGYRVFQGCPLTNVRIGDGVTSLGMELFIDCYQLKTVYIPNSVITIERSFCFCNNLENVTFEDTASSWTVQGWDYNFSTNIDTTFTPSPTDTSANATALHETYARCTWTKNTN